MGTPIDVEAIGEDEQDAIQAVQQVFSSLDGAESADRAPQQQP